MKATAIIQARTASMRLPGKVVKPLNSKTVLENVIERTLKASQIEKVIVATTTRAEDDIIVRIAEKVGVDYFRGSEEDVLGRYYLAAGQFSAGLIARITADCPLIIPSVIDDVVNLRNSLKVDYASNTIRRTFPRGTDTEVFTFSALESAYNEAAESREREHVTPYLINNPHRFSQANLEAQGRLRRPDLRITIDTEEDYMLIQAIYQFLGARSIELDRIINLFNQQPWLFYINNNVKQKPV